MGRGVKIPWVGGSIYTMGRGVIKFQNFQKSSKFQNFYKISKKNINSNKNKKNSKRIQYFKNFKKLQNKISKLTNFIRFKFFF